REALRFFLGEGDDALGLFQGVALLQLEFGELGLRLIAQLLRLVELGFDLRRARIEPLGDRVLDLVDEEADRDDEGDQDPKFGLEEKFGHQLRSLSACSTALAARVASSPAPVSFCAASRVASMAISRSEPSACCFASPMRRSAAAVSFVSSSPTLRWRSADCAL